MVHLIRFLKTQFLFLIQIKWRCRLMFSILLLLVLLVLLVLLLLLV
jgi:hypothetical protein